MLVRAERVESEILALTEDIGGGFARCEGSVRITSVPVVVNRLLLPHLGSTVLGLGQDRRRRRRRLSGCSRRIPLPQAELSFLPGRRRDHHATPAATISDRDDEAK